jgi:hypothetical protein
MRIQPEVAAFVGKIDFDPDALFAKYMSERDKRLREDGIDQYVEVRPSSPATSKTHMSNRGSPVRRCSTRCSLRSSAADLAVC